VLRKSSSSISTILTYIYHPILSIEDGQSRYIQEDHHLYIQGRLLPDLETHKKNFTARNYSKVQESTDFMFSQKHVWDPIRDRVDMITIGTSHLALFDMDL